MRILILTTCFLFFCLLNNAAAQTPDTTGNDKYMELLTIMTTMFDIVVPDTSFKHGSDPSMSLWEDAKTGARISCGALPVSLDEIMTDLAKEKSPEGNPLKVEPLETNGVKGQLIRTTTTSPEDGEVWEMLMFLHPYKEKYCVNLSAVFPQKHHDLLYAKIIQSFGTATPR